MSEKSHLEKVGRKTKGKAEQLLNCNEISRMKRAKVENFYNLSRKGYCRRKHQSEQKVFNKVLNTKKVLSH